jgi:hypothetical protein
LQQTKPCAPAFHPNQHATLLSPALIFIRVSFYFPFSKGAKVQKPTACVQLISIGTRGILHFSTPINKKKVCGELIKTFHLKKV